MLFFFLKIFALILIANSFGQLVGRNVSEQPHWSVNNIQFSNNFHSRRPRIHSALRVPRFPLIESNRMPMLSRYLRERQNQRELSANLMSSFGSRVVNNNNFE